MAYIKNPTPEQRRQWNEQQERLREELSRLVENYAKDYENNPEQLAELFAFGSKFYKYSVRNNMLIHGQNAHALYVQSFQAWKTMGADIKKGEKGIKVYVPVQATILKIGDKLVPLEQATSQERARYNAGELESMTKTRFKIGHVFDIAQTTFPKERYPSLFHMGYPSKVHGLAAKGLEDYAKKALKCKVSMVDLKSISLRGNFAPETNEIKLNQLLEDTQKLSTLAHELGHAILHKNTKAGPVQKELEADAMGIMVEAHFGIEPTETRRRHLADNYQKYQKEYKANPGQRPSFGEVIKNVFQSFKEQLPAIEQAVEKHVPKSSLQETLPVPVPREKTASVARSQNSVGNGQIYEEMKRQIRITDYAQSHGFHVERVGRYYTLAEHGSVRIDPDRNCFFWNSGIDPVTHQSMEENSKGSVIDFAMALVHGHDKHEALKELGSLVYMPGQGQAPVTRREAGQAVASPPKKSLAESLPPKAAKMHRAYAYLTKSRYIDPDVVQEFVDRKMLYQDDRGNCVFVAHAADGKPNFATLRGTLTEKRFTADVPGNDYTRNFYINNGADKLIVAESVIDTMSVMSILEGQGIDHRKYDYLALTGTAKEKAVLTHLQETPKKEVLLSLDRDLAGVSAAGKIEGQIRKVLGDNPGSPAVTFHVPREGRKDWNDELASAAKSLRPMDSIPYLQGGSLPAIRSCAIQSTEHVQERGFRQRSEKNQYRLVELAKDGSLQPVTISDKPSEMYFSEKEVKDRLPDLCVIVPYDKLMEERQEIMGKDIQTEQEKAAAKAESPNAGKGHGNQPVKATLPESKENPLIKGARMEEGITVLDIEYKGKQTIEAIWKNEKGFYYTTGMAFEDTLEEHALSQEELDGIRKSCPEIISVNEYITEQKKEQNPVEKKSEKGFLERLQEQELKNELQLEKTAGLELGI